MSHSSACDDDNDCMICLFPLLGESQHELHREEDVPKSTRNTTTRSRASRMARTFRSSFTGSQAQAEQDYSTNSTEIGAVFPCGHVFHIKCWQQYNKDKCPVCNQAANLFSKLFISSSRTTTTTKGDLSHAERLELEQYRRQAREQSLDHNHSNHSNNSSNSNINNSHHSTQDRMLLRDMEKQVEEDPQGAKMMMTMMMMVQSRDLRKAERELQDSRDECATAKEILQVVQSELEDALEELEQVKPKMTSLQEQVDRLRKERKQAASTHTRSQDYKRQIKDLQEKLDRAKEKLALKNKQLSRRNKEIIAKRKLVYDHKMELEAKGRESQKVCQKTLEELKRTKKELELLRELDSFTLDESYSSYGHGSFHNSNNNSNNNDSSLTWNDALNLSP